MSKLNFMEACLAGEIFIFEIDDYVQAWHEGDSCESLYIYLGMTEEEYGLWVENESILAHILFARRNYIKIKELINWGEGEMLAARASSPEEGRKILEWLRRTGRITK